jgi:hypothetical protein
VVYAQFHLDGKAQAWGFAQDTHLWRGHSTCAKRHVFLCAQRC